MYITIVIIPHSDTYCRCGWIAWLRRCHMGNRRIISLLPRIMQVGRFPVAMFWISGVVHRITHVDKS